MEKVADPNFIIIIIIITRNILKLSRSIVTTNFSIHQWGPPQFYPLEQISD